MDSREHPNWDASTLRQPLTLGLAQLLPYSFPIFLPDVQADSESPEIWRGHREL